VGVVVVLGGEEGKRPAEGGERDSGQAKSRRGGWIRNWYVSDWEGGEQRVWTGGVGGDMGDGKGGNKEMG